MLIGQPSTSFLLRSALKGFGPDGEVWLRDHGSPSAFGCVLEVLCRTCEGAYEDQRVGYSRFELIRDTILKNTLGVSAGQEITTWNDATERTFAEVKELFEEMINSSKQSGD